eukprot:12365369-Alexandrium_andersonii.AAC.1
MSINSTEGTAAIGGAYIDGDSGLLPGTRPVHAESCRTKVNDVAQGVLGHCRGFPEDGQRRVMDRRRG